MQIRKMFIIPSLLTVMHGYTGHIILTWHIEDKKIKELLDKERSL